MREGACDESAPSLTVGLPPHGANPLHANENRSSNLLTVASELSCNIYHLPNVVIEVHHAFQEHPEAIHSPLGASGRVFFRPVIFRLRSDRRDDHIHSLIQPPQDFLLRRITHFSEFTRAVARVPGHGYLRADVVTQIAG